MPATMAPAFSKIICSRKTSYHPLIKSNQIAFSFTLLPHQSSTALTESRYFSRKRSFIDFRFECEAIKINSFAHTLSAFVFTGFFIMRFTFVESMIAPSFYAPLAQACEQAGFASFAVPDSIIYPECSDTRYPYTEDGNREFLENKAIIDPFVLMSTMAAVTSTLRFYPFVYKLPVRQPVLVAKQATSLAAISNNRFSLGVGLSPWPEDYIACNEPWEKRGKRFNEMLKIIRGLCNGGFYAFDGEFYQIPSLKLCPIPTQPVPILIGGHSDAALKRAVQYGDGWLHGGGNVDELEPLIKKLKGYLKEFDRDEKTFQIHAISMDAFSVDGVKRMQDLGITDAVVGFHNTYAAEQDNESLETKLHNINRYAEAVISKTNKR